MGKANRKKKGKLDIKLEWKNALILLVWHLTWPLSVSSLAAAAKKGTRSLMQISTGVILNIWSPGRWPQHHLRTGKMYKFSCSSPEFEGAVQPSVS